MNPVSLDRLFLWAARLTKTGYLPRHRYRHVSFLLSKSRVIAVGKNRCEKTHPRAVACGHFLSIHSELDCVLKLDNEDDARGLVMVNVQVRPDRHGNPGPRMSKPCERCQAYLRSVGVRQVVYSTGLLDIPWGVWEP